MKLVNFKQLKEFMAKAEKTILKDGDKLEDVPVVISQRDQLKNSALSLDYPANFLALQEDTDKFKNVLVIGHEGIVDIALNEKDIEDMIRIARGVA